MSVFARESNRAERFGHRCSGLSKWRSKGRERLSISIERCGLVHARGVRLLGGWHEVANQFAGFSVHAPNVAAPAAVIVRARAVAQRRQKPDQVTMARRTRWGCRHGETLEPSPPSLKGPALVLRAKTIAAVFDHREKRARATPQVREVARERYRLDVSCSAFWAARNGATTLIAGDWHVGLAALAARNVPTGHQRFAPNFRP